jgi:hypothetical protein
MNTDPPPDPAAPSQVSLFVCTTGGLLSPPGDAVEPARLLRLDLEGKR